MSTETPIGHELGLTDIERNSVVWLKVEAYLKARLDSHRAQNDGDLPPDATAKVRGRIAEIKKMLAAGAGQD